MTQLIDYKDLTTLSPNFKAGDTILLKDGTYNNLNVQIRCNGNSGNKIIIKPQNPGKVIITGTSTIIISGSYTTLCNIVMRNGGVTSRAVTIGGNNNRVTGFDVSYGLTSCEQMFRIEGRCCRVDHNIFHDWNSVGVWVVVWRTLSRDDYALIDHNIFRNRKPTSATNGLECIRVGTSTDSLGSSKTIVMYNQFFNCNGEIEMISNKSCDNIYYRNYLESSEGTITLRHGNNCYVHRNYFDQKSKSNTGGIRVTGENHTISYNLVRNVNGNGTTRCGISINNGVANSPLNGYFQVKNMLVKGNVIINCNDNFAMGVRVKRDCLLKPITSKIVDNIAYNPVSGEYFSSSSSCLGSDDMVYQNNIFYGKTLGKAPKTTGIIVKDPTTFDLVKFDSTSSNMYGCNEVLTRNWDNDPANSDIPDLVTHYNSLLATITSEVQNGI